MITINMMSKADWVQGQGVLSAYREQVQLVRDTFQDQAVVMQNRGRACDITHYHTINPEYFLSIPFAKASGVTVGYVHFLPETLEQSIHLPSVVKKVFYRYVIAFYKKMDFLVTVNPYFIEKLVDYGIPQEKIFYIPNFVCEKKFYPVSAEEKTALRKKYDLPADRFVVFCAGQLQKRKGVLDFLELAKKMPQIQFLWAGTFAFGKISDGYEEIQRALENPPENVRFLGLVERSRMNELYNVADLMFLPSYEELFPMTILEAMNCATPILLRDLDIYPNILFDFYQKGNSIEDFARIIEELAGSQKAYQTASAASFRGHQMYSREYVGQLWKQFYQMAVEKNPRRIVKPLPAATQLACRKGVRSMHVIK